MGFYANCRGTVRKNYTCAEREGMRNERDLTGVSLNGFLRQKRVWDPLSVPVTSVFPYRVELFWDFPPTLKFYTFTFGSLFCLLTMQCIYAAIICVLFSKYHLMLFNSTFFVNYHFFHDNLLFIDN